MANGPNFDPYVGDDETTSARERMLSGEEPRAGIGGVTIRYKPQHAVPHTQTGTSTQTQTTKYTGERPGAFDKPVWDEGEIKKVAQQIAAPKIRQLRQEVQRATTKHYENPNVRRMMLRSALQGYGIGLGNIAAGARTAAASEYAQRYSFDFQAAASEFDAAWREYLGTKEITQVGTSTGTSGPTSLMGGTTPTGSRTIIPGAGYQMGRRPNVASGSVGQAIRSGTF